MKERPILFSAPMVRAILDGTKTQTRRALLVQPLDVLPMEGEAAGKQWVGLMTRDPKPEGTVFRCKFGQTGDRLWVRETFAQFIDYDVIDGRSVELDRDFVYRADGEDQKRHTAWRPSIHMPRAASRIDLEITGVRIERLTDCSEADAIAEGIERSGECNWCDYLDYGYNDFTNARHSYRSLWESINGAGSWEANPWVWVVEFKRVEALRMAA
ncbi:hypothetical protein [Noviherbaspirillum malthae]|uniref:hypothetical protein n=1 Tax=Noviherbaspirillum malthae TaxID=1260987 RepID=UPI00188EEF2A|nr:hypothetical protein [Noviherbaspirillum malthae]